MEVFTTPIKDLKLIKLNSSEDLRGSFARCFCDEELSEFLRGRSIKQINHSRTKQVGAIRGLHFQKPPFCEMKLIRCLKGLVWDVAVDLRSSSKTFLQWHAIKLCPSEKFLFVIPEGFAHGFQVLEPDSELLYLHTAQYKPAFEGGISHNDPRLGIQWPLDAQDLSMRDLSHPLLNDQFLGIKL